MHIDFENSKAAIYIKKYTVKQKLRKIPDKIKISDVKLDTKIIRWNSTIILCLQRVIAKNDGFEVNKFPLLNGSRILFTSQLVFFSKYPLLT